MYNYIRENRFFQRNAAVAMGNSGDESYIPDLVQELDNEHEIVRTHVAWALKRLRP
jgi:epoxyqueuosine reductase